MANKTRTVKNRGYLLLSIAILLLSFIGIIYTVQGSDLNYVSWGALILTTLSIFAILGGKMNK